MKSKYQAFTLIELLIVMAILIILMGIGLFGGRFIFKQAQITRHTSVLAELSKATEGYYLEHNRYPEGSSTLTSFQTLVEHADGLEPYFDKDFDGGDTAVYYYYVGNQGQDYLYCVESDSYEYYLCDGTDFSLPGSTVEKKGDALTQAQRSAATFSGTWTKNSGWGS